MDISYRRSLSEGIMLEDNDPGYVHFSGNHPNEIQRGDEMVGSTKKSAIDILKLIEPYNGRNQGLSKSAMRPSKSLGNLDNSIKAPEELHNDTYNRLYNAKVRRFLKQKPQGKSQEDMSNPLTSHLRLGR
ncbi:uncharacterized protein si:ch211-69b7.6 isoform X2 [Clarias gariepinus]|nr:uncharacterized protein si:ch211-69b7.6 isoform X2 [Clarias gariepinus]